MINEILNEIDPESLSFDLFLEQILKVLGQLTELESVVIRKRVGLYDGTIHDYKALEDEEGMEKQAILDLEDRVSGLIKSVKLSKSSSRFENHGVCLITGIRLIVKHSAPDRDILFRRFGLVDGDCQSLQALSKQYNKSIEEIGALEKHFFNTVVSITQK